MVLHLLALVKLKLLATTHSCFNPLFPCLVYPYVLKVCFGLRYDISQVYASIANFSRFFLFQLGHIVFHGRPENGFGYASRWRRALRLVCDMVNDIVNHATPSAADSPWPSSSNYQFSTQSFGLITLWCLAVCMQISIPDIISTSLLEKVSNRIFIGVRDLFFCYSDTYYSSLLSLYAKACLYKYSEVWTTF